MRKPRDYDAELKALTDKARQLKTRKTSQLGELVNATGADALSSEVLAGALLDAATTTDAARKEAWRKSGAAFFSGDGKSPRAGAGNKPRSAATEPGSAQLPLGEPGAA
ncbi:conjugative transfer protein TraD [Novosphingobium sp. PhB55]|uniref:conjugal transfer protein TraD n=1 Tax=Novosphingobium sp. PhB55 TaxID=2485106 RepID=UPI0010659854|nr:conjugal transfer protein TraD [Novosphingobium sp. PhB55]TDW65423.1 conjugative transfer protein TraD [Novosphingobium sp. PhB55]